VHILIAHNNYAKFSGEEHAVHSMAEILIFFGHQISWLQQSSADIGDSITKKIGAFFSGIYSIESKKQIEHIVNTENIDLVQIQNLYPFLSSSILLAVKKKKVPVVMRCPNYRLFCPNGLHFTNNEICERCLYGKEWNCILHNCEGNRFKSLGYSLRNVFARMSGMIKNNVDVFLVLSEFQKKRFLDGGIPADRIEILPNIAPVIDNAENNRYNGDTISFVGRVSPEKGVSQFINAARKLSQYRFSLAGSTNAMPDVKKNAPSNIRFMGFLSGNDLNAFYLESRIIVFPSIWFEGFPNVVATAMAYGKPVIASRIGALPEIVDDGVTGLLFEPGSTADLIEKIEYLWNRPNLCKEMGQAGLKKAKTKYSKQKYYNRLMSVYEKARNLNNKRI
jgi:glycosyltransferase involved in cell wall biosynthesis